MGNTAVPAELVPSTVPAIPDALFEAGRRFPSFVPTAADEDSDDSDQCGPEVVSDPVDREDNLDTKVDALQKDLESCVPSPNCSTAKEVAHPHGSRISSHHSRWCRVE